ncbi:hypothetical protein AYL99_11883 [Fonsecaea erecta]|uniref:Uncharacterized protein n=1 Tax=Fonsecaea erecta TaxID=1367422 RepID=A0A178Z2X4_9EURO|nr:hypothetical protein AYL99_11883 [Fonsecaea erecta]OAP53861.1 hypothetical protein AYL99_11883 [Fonsecaea erecta]
MEPDATTYRYEARFTHVIMNVSTAREAILYELGATYASLILSMIDLKSRNLKTNMHLAPYRDLFRHRAWLEKMHREGYSVLIIGEAVNTLMEGIRDPERFWKTHGTFRMTGGNNSLMVCIWRSNRMPYSNSDLSGCTFDHTTAETTTETNIVRDDCTHDKTLVPWLWAGGSTRTCSRRGTRRGLKTQRRDRLHGRRAPPQAQVVLSIVYYRLHDSGVTRRVVEMNGTLVVGALDNTYTWMLSKLEMSPTMKMFKVISGSEEEMLMVPYMNMSRHIAMCIISKIFVLRKGSGRLRVHTQGPVWSDMTTILLSAVVLRQLERPWRQDTYMTTYTYMSIKRCRATSSVCFVCKEGLTNIIPCDKRTEEAPGITLFAPTECVNRQKIVVSFHPDCMGDNLTMTASTTHKEHSDDIKKAVLKMAFKMDLTVYLVGPGDDNKMTELSVNLTTHERTNTREQHRRVDEHAHAGVADQNCQLHRHLVTTINMCNITFTVCTLCLYSLELIDSCPRNNTCICVTQTISALATIHGPAYDLIITVVPILCNMCMESEPELCADTPLTNAIQMSRVSKIANFMNRRRSLNITVKTLTSGRPYMGMRIDRNSTVVFFENMD